MLNFFLSPIFIILLIGISFYIQYNVGHVIKKYHKMPNTRGITGAKMAQIMLDKEGITDVNIQKGQGKWVKKRK